MANLFQRLFGIKKKALSPTAANLQLGGQLLFYRDRKEDFIKKGYEGNDIVYSIINLITNKVRVPEWGWYTVEDEKAYKEYCAAITAMSVKNYQQYAENESAEVSKDYKSMMALRTKAIKPYTANTTMNELLQYPNDTQTWSDLMEESAGFKLITGDKYKYGELSKNGLNKDFPLTISNLPSQYMVIKSATGLPFTEESYELQMGVFKPFTKEEVLHEKYYNPDWDMHGNQLYGLSPIKAAWKRIQRSNEGQTAGISAFRNGGAEGFMSPDLQDLSQLENLSKEALDAIKERVDAAIGGGSARAGSIAVLSSPWKYERIRMSPVDLNIINSEQWDMRMLCNVWGVPSQLMNDPENKIQANASAGERALTTRCAMPILISERASLNRKFQTHWGLKGKRYVADFDPTVFTELEETKKDQVTWLKDAWWLTPNQKLNIMNEPVSEDPNMDKVYIPSGYVPIDQTAMPEPDVTALDEENLNDYDR